MDPIKSIAIPIKRRRDSGKIEVSVRPALPGEGRLVNAAAQYSRPVPKPALRPKHLYRVGQRLRMLGGGNRWARVESVCKVVVLMPYEGGALMYRVRSDAENYERVVAEIDLQPIA